ncbi:hypothetical protein P3X46_000825, partial [Hevea brasiliensis]
MDILNSIHLCRSKDDRLIWMPNSNGQFTVNSLYKRLLQATSSDGFNLPIFWKGLAPTKVELLVWLASQSKLQDRLCSFNLIPSSQNFWINLFYAIMRSIWLARIKKNFKNEDLSFSDLCVLILHRLSIWMRALDIDFSFSAIDLLCSIGGVLRDGAGSFICIFSCHAGWDDTNMAEVMAIEKALHLSSTFPGLCCYDYPLIIESDSTNAISWVKCLEFAPWRFNSVLKSILESLSVLPSVSFKGKL